MTREEAIRRLKNMAWLYGSVEREPHIEAIDMAIEALSDRPTDEWCTDCKEYDHEKHCCPRFNRVIRATLNEAVANLKEEFESADDVSREECNCVFSKPKPKLSKKVVEFNFSNMEVVVRCKDCRWYENRYGKVCHNPRYGDGHANYSPPYVDEEYFCKDGERREE